MNPPILVWKVPRERKVTPDTFLAAIRPTKRPQKCDADALASAFFPNLRNSYSTVLRKAASTEESVQISTKCVTVDCSELRYTLLQSAKLRVATTPSNICPTKFFTRIIGNFGAYHATTEFQTTDH
jgi:hypothetical protein